MSLRDAVVGAWELVSFIASDATGVERHPLGDAPRGVYPSAGDDEWLVITVRGDADFAAESANLTRAQILVQSGTSVLGIANKNPENVLSLLH